MTIVRVVGATMVLGATVIAILRADGSSLKERLVHVLGLRRLRGRSVAGLSLVALFAVAGMGDLGGNVFFVLSKHAGAFSVAVVLSSLYPVITTIIARLVLNERLRPLQIAGVVLAALSIPLLR
jgi:drug/metabolite transporter (DMT)-like permease